jgi:hypothetical protein
VSSGPRTIRELLGFTSDGLTDRQLQVIGASPEVAGVRKEKLPSGWKVGASRAVAKVLESAMNTPIADLVAQTCSKYLALLKYRNKAEYPPEQVFEVTLVEHAVKSTHEPTVAVLWNGETIAEVPFEVELALRIDGARLRIQDGSIWGISTGKCHCDGTISCSGATLFERSSREFELPGDVQFSEGIPIVPGANPKS